MSKSKKNNTGIWLVTIITIIFAFYTQIVWFVLVRAKNPPDHDKTVQLFLDYFPPFMQNIAVVTFITLACCIVAIIFSTKLGRRTARDEKMLSFIVLVLAIVFLLLTVLLVI